MAKEENIRFLLCRASAGSGKTYALVKEYLKIALENQNSFKHILGITFTNKAAGEMKERIIHHLQRLSRGEDGKLKSEIKKELLRPLDIQKSSSDILRKRVRAEDRG